VLCTPWQGLCFCHRDNLGRVCLKPWYGRLAEAPADLRLYLQLVLTRDTE
jgi:hypothetical protein